MSLNLEHIKIKLDKLKEHTTFCAEEHSLTNEEVDKLNELPEDIKKLIKRYCLDEYKQGYSDGSYQTRCCVEGEII